MRYSFVINGEDKLVLSAEGEKEKSLLSMIFPTEGNYQVSLVNNEIIIRKGEISKLSYSSVKSLD